MKKQRADFRLRAFPDEYRHFATFMDAIKFHINKGGSVFISAFNTEHFGVQLGRADWLDKKTKLASITVQECMEILGYFH